MQQGVLWVYLRSTGNASDVAGRRERERERTMFCAGIEVTDADSAEAAADAMDEVELVDVVCPECDGARSVCDLSSELGWIDIACPCCGGFGTIEVPADGSDGWDDPEPPVPPRLPPRRPRQRE